VCGAQEVAAVPDHPVPDLLVRAERHRRLVDLD
jgi:hypothetical protein